MVLNKKCLKCNRKYDATTPIQKVCLRFSCRKLVCLFCKMDYLPSQLKIQITKKEGEHTRVIYYSI